MNLINYKKFYLKKSLKKIINNIYIYEKINNKYEILKKKIKIKFAKKVFTKNNKDEICKNNKYDKNDKNDKK